MEDSGRFRIGSVAADSARHREHDATPTRRRRCYQQSQARNRVGSCIEAEAACPGSLGVVYGDAGYKMGRRRETGGTALESGVRSSKTS